MKISNCFLKIEPLPIVGYETQQRQKLYPYQTNKHWSDIPWDVGTKLIGYIPVLSIIVGVGRLVMALGLSDRWETTSHQDALTKNRMIRYCIGRGILEIVGFGVLPMALDFSKAAITCALIYFNKQDGGTD